MYFVVKHGLGWFGRFCVKKTIRFSIGISAKSARTWLKPDGGHFITVICNLNCCLSDKTYLSNGNIIFKQRNDDKIRLCWLHRPASAYCVMWWEFFSVLETRAFESERKRERFVLWYKFSTGETGVTKVRPQLHSFRCVSWNAFGLFDLCDIRNGPILDALVSYIYAQHSLSLSYSAYTRTL